jgi:hypothetical protein
MSTLALGRRRLVKLRGLVDEVRRSGTCCRAHVHVRMRVDSCSEGALLTKINKPDALGQCMRDMKIGKHLRGLVESVAFAGCPAPKTLKSS